MITLTGPDGQVTAFAPDSIEHVEAGPPTALVMTSGRKHEVTESIGTVVARIREWRASVMAMVDFVEIESHPAHGHSVRSNMAPNLTLVADKDT